MPYCNECGSKLVEENQFCGSCGAKVQVPQQVPQAAKPKTQSHTARNIAIFVLIILISFVGVPVVINSISNTNGNGVPSGYSKNSDGTYCPTGYPYYAPSTSTCYQEQINGLGSGGSIFVYTPYNNGAAGWTVQAIGADNYRCSNGNQNCQCSQVYVHTYHGVTGYSYEYRPNNGESRSEPGYQYPDLTSYHTLSNGYPTPDGAYSIAVVDYSGGQAAVYCISVFHSSAPPV